MVEKTVEVLVSCGVVRVGLLFGKGVRRVYSVDEQREILIRTQRVTVTLPTGEVRSYFRSCLVGYNPTCKWSYWRLPGAGEYVHRSLRTIVARLAEQGVPTTYVERKEVAHS